MITTENPRIDEIKQIIDEVERLYFDENLKLEEAIRQIKEKKESEQNRNFKERTI